MGTNASVVAKRLILTNTVGKVALPRKDPKTRMNLSHKQAAGFADAAGDLGPAVKTLAYTGLRLGELTALHGPDNDPVGRRISVNRNAVQVGSKVIVGTRRRHMNSERCHSPNSSPPS